MDEHRFDKREYIYSYKELEEGCTHDVYWNAAQFELVFTHKVSKFLSSDFHIIDDFSIRNVG